jgi:L-alanine-DL-glutamate epimerase-like enolase superfamily enzyme
VPISRFADPAVPSGGLDTSMVAVVTDTRRNGSPVVGYGFGSFGRYAQSGLIRERFAPRLLAAGGGLDPVRAWEAMMAGEKPGGHGERCVAVGTLDMALWDAAAKIAGLPLHRHLGDVLPQASPRNKVRVYAAGGYRYPSLDLTHLQEEARRLLDSGYDVLKIKVGGATLAADLRRIEAVLRIVGVSERLAVDAMHAWDGSERRVAKALEPYRLRWLEDVGDPLNLVGLSTLVSLYDHPIAAGEALFSSAEAALLHRYGGLRPERDILVFDPVHCYGLPGFLAIIGEMERAGWPRSAFWPHGGHLFCLHLVAALGLGGAEVNPLAFQPFGGLTDKAVVDDGYTAPPEALGIGFEQRAALQTVLDSLGSF